MAVTSRTLLIGVAACALFAPQAAQAQTAVSATDAVQLQTVTVESGEAGASDGVAGTQTTSTTTRAAIDNQLIDTIQDLGRTQEAGISFNRATNSINIRGLEGPRVLTTIDGIRVPYLSDVTRGANGGADSFDFNALSALDVTRGADPLLGSGALGGVLALRTLEPEDLLLGGRRIGTLSKSGYDSADRSGFTSHALAIRAGDTTALVQGTYRSGHETETMGEADSLGASRTKANPADDEAYSLLAKVYQNVEGGHRFGFAGEIYHRDATIDGRTSQSATGNYRAGNYHTGEEVERRKAALTYDFDTPDGEGWIDTARAVLYYQDVSRDTTVDALRSTSVIGPFTRDNSIEEAAVGFNGFASKTLDAGSVRHRLTFGTELRSADTTQYSAGRDACSLRRARDRFACGMLHTNQADAPDVTSRLVGLYGEDEVSLLVGRLRVTPGLRFDWYDNEPESTPEYRASAAYDGKLPPENSDHAFSPKIGVEYDLVPALTAYAQYTRGFRAPTVGELYSRYGAVGSYLRRGNADLEAETSDGFDVGLRAGDEALGARINLFTTRYQNFIDTVQLTRPGGEYPLGGVSSYTNVPDARISGVELGTHARFLDHWTARASLAYAEGRNLTDDTYLDSVPPLTAILGLGYAQTHWGGEVTTKLAARRDKVDDGFTAPGYGVVDVTAWVEPEPLPGLKIAAGIFNLFDKTYYDAVNVPETRSQPNLFYSEPGRSFRVNATYRF
ncbi:TonB-dependent hemoglobin/transferrin/lactoferrin family receptor [Aureimonas sp. D3]|uniref:TonB-dependent hemoglobin/transferrin/lactoferrin family receptor n=1 Tax=Aureimonas sp. D3 TaxID=1638164 RepID=UPI0007824E59|nr:TonB-dependent hemoglobin/transferrin/lactoferrin family receptor [Aureimonas sp. D3]